MNNNRIMIFGDSVLKGVMYLEDGIRGKYKLYGGALESRMAGRGIELTRCCHMGATIDVGLDRMKKMLAKGTSFENTTVLLEFGGNDCAYNWREVSEHPEEAHKPKIETGRFCELYREAIALARSAGGDVMLSSLVPIDATKYMNFISRGLSYDNILSWLGDVICFIAGTRATTARSNSLPMTVPFRFSTCARNFFTRTRLNLSYATTASIRPQRGTA